MYYIWKYISFPKKHQQRAIQNCLLVSCKLIKKNPQHFLTSLNINQNVAQVKGHYIKPLNHLFFWLLNILFDRVIMQNTFTVFECINVKHVNHYIIYYNLLTHHFLAVESSVLPDPVIMYNTFTTFWCISVKRVKYGMQILNT